MLASRVVLGVEADVSSGGIRQATTADTAGTSSNLTTVFDSETVRGRLGYAFDDILLYGTAGWAWSNNQYIRTQITGTLNLATAGTDEAVNTYLGGWTAGAGVAVAFAQNWNAFAEYRYTNFGSVGLVLPFSQLSTNLTTKVSAVELGLNYKFNWGAPASAGSVAAPNLRRPAPALVYKSPPASGRYTWTGFYIGGDGGYGWETARGTLTTAGGVPLAPYSPGVNGPFAGGFVGGNYQFDHVVAGVEGDWQWGNLTGNNQQQAAIGAAGAFPGGPFTIATTIKDYESIRGRLGIAYDRFLVFGTGGWAWGNPSTSYALLGAAPFVTNGGSSNGWTVGAGVDYAFTNNVFGRIEYRYTNLATASFVNVATNSADAGNKAAISDVRVGIGYRFGGG